MDVPVSSVLGGSSEFFVANFTLGFLEIRMIVLHVVTQYPPTHILATFSAFNTRLLSSWSWMLVTNVNVASQTEKELHTHGTLLGLPFCVNPFDMLCQEVGVCIPHPALLTDIRCNLFVQGIDVRFQVLLIIQILAAVMTFESPLF